MLSILIWAYVLGIAAAAPVGPVNMLAIRRGLLHGWGHTLWVGLGSVAVESVYITMALWGGSKALEIRQVALVEKVISLPAGLGVILFGALIVRQAFHNTRRIMASFRLARIKRSPATIVRDIFLGAALTAFNPGTMLYWLLAAGPAWLGRAQLSAGDVRVWPGLMAAVMGLCTWFAFITALIRFRPQKVGPRFVRVVNVACGLLLIISGSAVAVTACLKLMGR